MHRSGARGPVRRRLRHVGGGCGMATMGLLAERLPGAALVQGARSANVVLFRERFPEQVLFTDDGSAGRPGFPTQWLQEQVGAGALDMVYTCGPELMMAALADVCRWAGIGCQVSMERYMKCGIGVCGQCDCDGLLICRDGPTFDLDDLARMPSFGRYRRDKTGKRIEITPSEQCPSGPRQSPATPVP